MDSDARITKLFFVRGVGGQPHVRWGRLAQVAVVISTLYIVLFWGLLHLTGMPISLLVMAIIPLSFLIFLAVNVEMQRQYVLNGKWTIRFGIGALLFLTLFTGLFVACVSKEIKYNTQQHALNAELTADLHAILGRGQAYISTLNGSNVLCFCERPNFSDEDLLELIERTEKRTNGMCPITFLDLRATDVSSSGLEHLKRCRKLESLRLPKKLAINDEAVTILAGLTNLRELVFNGTINSEDRMKPLKNRMPKVELNRHGGW